MKRILAVLITLAMLYGGVTYANEWTNDPSNIRPIITYKDVSQDFWGYAAITNATKYGWFSGHDDGTFKPNDVITRAEAAKSTANFVKLKVTPGIKSSYSDVDNTSWYSPYAEATKDLFYPAYGNEFKPSQSITREDALYLLVKAYGYDTLAGSVNTSILDAFADSEDINPTIKDYVAVGISYGLLAGFNDNTLKPGGFLTRVQFATLLNRLYSMGPNRVPTMATLERIEITSGMDMSIQTNGRAEIKAEAVYSDGKRMDFTNNLNIVTDSNDIIQIMGNRVYGLKKGNATIMFNNANLSGTTIEIAVY